MRFYFDTRLIECVLVKDEDMVSIVNSFLHSFHFSMARRLLLLLLLLCLLVAVIDGSSQCSCTCCKGNRCIQQYQGSFSMLTCSASSCKRACKARYPTRCGGSPGSLLATCTKTKKPHRLSPVKKIKQRLRPSSHKHNRYPR